MPRKIIQISTSIADNHLVLHALCNDGSLWYQSYNAAKQKDEWKLDTQIPQDGYEESDDVLKNYREYREKAIKRSTRS